MGEKTRASSESLKNFSVQPRTETSAQNAFLALLDDIRGDVDARLRGFLDSAIDQAAAHGSDVEAMVAAVRDLCLRGGKRLRPALLVAGFRATGTRARLGPALDAGVALELLHTYLLIHDDWMDEDTIRRGGPAVHLLLSRRFRSSKLGDAAGILAGDCAAGLALEALSRVDVPPSRMPRVIDCFARMQIDAVFGQQLDLVGKTRDAESVYALKTSSYSVQGPLKLGALLADCSNDLLRVLDRFGMPLGIAFQLRDDLLGVFGRPDEIGKPVGGDLRQGKRTALIGLALRKLRGGGRRAVTSVFGNPEATAAELRRAVEVLETSGIRGLVERRIAELSAEARKALEAARLPTRTAQVLGDAVNALLDRGH